MTFLSTLLSVSVGAAVVFCAVTLFKRLFHKRLSPTLQYGLWALLVLRLLLPFNVRVETTLPLNAWLSPSVAPAADAADAGTGNTAAVQSIPQRPEQAPADTARATAQMPDSAATPQAYGQAGGTAAAAQPISWTALLLCAWGTGVAVSLAVLGYRHIQLCRLIRRTRRPVPAAVTQTYSRCLCLLRVRHAPELVVVDGVASAAITASPRPRILIPEFLTRKENAQSLYFALIHELTHYKRGDHLVGLLLPLLSAAYWFHPAVHIGFACLRQDMETACDAGVQRVVGESQKQAYRLTIMGMFSGAFTVPALGMSAPASRRMAQRRVRGMFMRPKSDRLARFSAFATALALLVVCFTTACQPTPETPPVVNKAESAQKLESALGQSQAPAAQPVKALAPDTWKDTIQKEGSKFTLEIDAQVVAPQVDAIPLYRVSSHAFTQEDVDKVAHALMGDAELYEGEVPATRAELQEYILQLQSFIADMKAQGITDNGNATIEDYEDSIEHYKKELETARDSSEPIQIDTTLKDGVVKIATEVDGQKARFVAVTRTNDGISDSDSETNGWIDYSKEETFVKFKKDMTDYDEFSEEYSAVPDDTPVTGEMTEQEIDAMAQTFLRGIGLTDFAVWDTYTDMVRDGDAVIQYYHLKMQRVTDGIMHNYCNVAGPFSSEPDSYAEGFVNEMVSIGLNRNGISAFYWSGPMVMGEKETENVELLPFEQIQTAFVNRMQFQNAWADTGKFTYTDPEGVIHEDTAPEVESLRICVDKVQLGYMRVFIKDDLPNTRLIPVWDFYGYETRQSADPEEPLMTTRDDLGVTGTPLATISALDGSLLDRYMGY